MTARIYPWLVLTFWTAMMSWLMVSKILPPLRGGIPPDYAAALAPSAARSEPVGWRISWNERRIGTAVTQVVDRKGIGTALRQVVHFERLPFQAMLSDGFGPLGSYIAPFLGDASALEIDMQLATELGFDPRHQFSDFRTVVDIGGTPGLLVLDGRATERQTLVVSTLISPSIGGVADKVLRHEISLPQESLVSDTFAPRSELKNLSVGQQWTIPIYRPFPPNSPVQIVAATALRLDVIVWNGRDVETILVEYREDAGSGLHAAREPMVLEWVRLDGRVVRREIRFSGLNIVFERLPRTGQAPEFELLDPGKHPRLWPADSPNRDEQAPNPEPIRPAHDHSRDTGSHDTGSPDAGPQYD